MELTIGKKVCLKMPLSYLKTADSMPMLRPPDLVSSDEQGEVVAFRGDGIVEVRFRRGTFLISLERLEICLNHPDNQPIDS